MANFNLWSLGVPKNLCRMMPCLLRIWEAVRWRVRRLLALRSELVNVQAFFVTAPSAPVTLNRISYLDYLCRFVLNANLRPGRDHARTSPA